MGKKIKGNDEPHNYLGKRIAIQSLGLNILLTAIEYYLHTITKSTALLAGAVHSFTDVIGSLLVITGIYLSEKKSERFPWGLYKVENLTALFVGGLIFFSSYEICYWKLFTCIIQECFISRIMVLVHPYILRIIPDLDIVAELRILISV